MKKFVCLFLFFISIIASQAQFGLTPAQRDSLNLLTRADHNNMLGQLGIKPEALRKGPSGNPKDPNAANSLESKVNAYVLPEILILHNGKKIKTVSQWTNIRKPEIMADFENEIYGKLPDNIPGVNWQIVSSKDTMQGNIPIIEKTLKGIVDNSRFPDIKVEMSVLLVLPKGKTNVPIVLELGFIKNPYTPKDIKTMGMGYAIEPVWQEQLLQKGWGFAILEPNSVQADHGAGLKTGIIGLVNKGQNRQPDQWGALRAWAWGASKTIDFISNEKEVDPSKIAIEGLSRYGKVALVAMAFEPRISLGFIGSSGAGGAKIIRRVFGEQIENLAGSGEYHWFCGNFIKYASLKTPLDLPIDAHHLIAICAPRPVFISVGSPQIEGNWIDANGMFIAAEKAGEAYTLFGKKGLETKTIPPLGTALVSGEIAFRQHAGGHTTGPNWSTWIAWASKYWDK